MITGQVYDVQTGQLLDAAIVSYLNLETKESGSTGTNSAGIYAFPLLAPGTYSLNVRKSNYQPQETSEIRLFVAGRVELSFPMRRQEDIYGSDLYNNGGFFQRDDPIIHFYAADIETTRPAISHVLSGQAGTLQSTLSYTIDPAQVTELPLSGRDIYSLLVTLPGVTADNATARGLGLSINGQRVSSSNYLLDGLENNDYLLTGPLTAIAPEAIQEYRVSTNNYSAEYGRTGGFIANAVTQSGTDFYRGLAYAYLGNELLNANAFDRNAQLIARAPLRETHVGYSVGGPILRKRLFFSSAFETSRNNNRQEPVTFRVPALDRIRNCAAADSQALKLLTQFAPPNAVAAPIRGTPCAAANLSAPYTVAEPVSLERTTVLERIDRHSKDGTRRLMGRVLLSRVAQPDFIYSPYAGLTSRLHSNSSSVAVSYIQSFRASAWNELKLGWRTSDLGWNRPHSEIPTLFANDGTILPGSSAAYEYHDGGNYGEIADSFTLIRGRHAITAGAGLLLLRSNSLLSFGRDGYYSFFDTSEFTRDAPRDAVGTIPRESQNPVRYDRTYSNNQFFGFVQDNVKASSRLGVNIGLRYESFGAPRNTGVQDGFIDLPPGTTVVTGLSKAPLVFPNDRTESVYRPDRNNWAGRFGFSYNLFGNGRTTFRGGYGIFYDRPFDNLTQNTRNNDFLLAGVTLCSRPPCRSYPYLLDPVSSALAAGNALNRHVSSVYWIDRNLRTPYVQSWFAGVQHQIANDLYVEISHMGALGRKLISTDHVNRDGENAGLDDVIYRSNSGSSDYMALGALARYRWSRGQFQVAYTYSHSIDNQSEPLLGDFFDLTFIAPAQTAGRKNISAFTRQFDSRVDRGNSDFDQRHNVVFYSIWQLPGTWRRPWLQRIAGGWQAAQIAGFRSGFPFTVYAPDEDSTLIGNRANLLPGQNPFLSQPTPAGFGVQLLNPNAFKAPPPGTVGNLGRNSLIGPGFWNVDLSLAKSFSFARLGERRRIQLRADAFNAFNHVNLNNPVNFMQDFRHFGQAQFGRTGTNSAFPAMAPLNESPRQIQLQIKLYF